MKTKVLIGILSVLIVILGGMFAYKIIQDKNNIQTVAEEEPPKVEEEDNTIDIFNGEDRPIAVMIDNHKDAWPQAGLNKAYLVYEIIVEGGETRLMALFKGVSVDKIGPVRSSRHYFLDYAMENDAIYTHYGWSPQAESDIKSFRINNINGIVESTSTFKRVNAKRKKYKTTSSKKSVLNYVAKEFDLEDGQVANSVTIPHSDSHTVKYTYDENNKVYKRSARGLAQTDWDTGDAITTKNIIITMCDNYTLNDKENKDRQGLKNIGTFNGYYISNGKAIKIKCTKEDRDEQTVYKDLEGNEIKTNVAIE